MGWFIAELVLLGVTGGVLGFTGYHFNTGFYWFIILAMNASFIFGRCFGL